MPASEKEKGAVHGGEDGTRKETYSKPGTNRSPPPPGSDGECRDLSGGTSELGDEAAPSAEETRRKEYLRTNPTPSEAYPKNDREETANKGKKVSTSANEKGSHAAPMRTRAEKTVGVSVASKERDTAGGIAKRGKDKRKRNTVEDRLPSARERTGELARRVKKFNESRKAASTAERSPLVHSTVSGEKKTQSLSTWSNPEDDFALVATGGKRKFEVDEEDVEEVQILLKDMKNRRAGASGEERGPAETKSKKKHMKKKRKAADGEPTIPDKSGKSKRREKSSADPKTCDQEGTSGGRQKKAKSKDLSSSEMEERGEGPSQVNGKRRKEQPSITYTPAVDLELNGGGAAGATLGMDKALIIHRFEYESKRGGSKMNGSGQRALAVFVQSRSEATVPPRGFGDERIGVARLNFTAAALCDAESLQVGRIVRMRFPGSTTVEPQAAEYRTFVNENKQLYCREKMLECVSKSSWKGSTTEVAAKRVVLDCHEISSEADLHAVLKLPAGKRYVSFYCELASEPPLPRSFFRKDQRSGGTTFLSVKIKLASDETRSLSIFVVRDVVFVL